MSEPIVWIKWTAWTFTYANGHGWQLFNLCKPDCAQGRSPWLRAYLTLSRVKQDGRAYFSPMAACARAGSRPPPA